MSTRAFSYLVFGTIAAAGLGVGLPSVAGHKSVLGIVLASLLALLILTAAAESWWRFASALSRDALEDGRVAYPGSLCAVHARLRDLTFEPLSTIVVWRSGISYAVTPESGMPRLDVPWSGVERIRFHPCGDYYARFQLWTRDGELLRWWVTSNCAALFRALIELRDTL